MLKDHFWLAAKHKSKEFGDSVTLLRSKWNIHKGLPKAGEIIPPATLKKSSLKGEWRVIAIFPESITDFIEAMQALDNTAHAGNDAFTEALEKIIATCCAEK
jgi:hypothetical protein